MVPCRADGQSGRRYSEGLEVWVFPPFRFSCDFFHRENLCLLSTQIITRAVAIRLSVSYVSLTQKREDIDAIFSQKGAWVHKKPEVE